MSPSNRLNPAERTAAESDYEKKFNRQRGTTSDSKDLKAKEAAGDADWKTTAGSQPKKAEGTTAKKGRFRFAGRRAGKLRQGSAFGFVVVMLLLGVWYTSVFAPNILLVNIKEMYTNDLSDATIALNTYYWKLMNYKIGRPQCSGSGTDSQPEPDIKCKLSTMSRAQKKAFEQHGFTVLGTQVTNDNRDDNDPSNDKPESRYEVAAIIPPMQSPGFIATGDMLWAYGQLSLANKYLVYSVFNPKSSFFQDTRFKQRIKSKYGLTKSFSVGGSTEQQVDRSFDNAVRNSGGGIDLFGRPDPTNGISLGSLSNPVTALQLEAAMVPLAAQANSFAGLQCSWYSFGKAVTNDAKSAKAATVARFAMQYLQAADTIKAGTADDVTINALSSKLGESASGSTDGQNATDSSLYKSIVYGQPPIPSIFGLLYSLDTFDLIGAMIPAWSQIMASAAAEGTASQVPGSLLMPPANLVGTDRDYCLGAEELQNHQQIKSDTESVCAPQIEADAPPGWQGALAPLLELGRETCVIPHYDEKDHQYEGQNIMSPTLKSATAMLSPYVAGLFSVNVIAWANVMSFFFTSQTKGVAASDAIFAGTGEILGDMAQSRGMMPGNAASMLEYLSYKPSVDKEFNDVARYSGRKNPMDPYNKFSFLGSIVHSLTPTYDEHAPLMATIANSFSLLGSSIKQLNPAANAIYYSQPDIFNPLRMYCPDPEYLAIFITADAGCNVRYSMSRLELAAQPDQVLDYMTKTHSDVYQSGIDELQERLAKADPELEQANITRMLTEKEVAAQQPFIDKKTGKATPNGEYDKFLQYCVNRQDPWGRSAIHVESMPLPDSEKQRRLSDKDNSLEPVSPQDSGDPYQDIRYAGFPSITEGTKADQDWYTGKKCLEQSEMLTNFRAYTMLCSVDGSLSGGVDCTDPDNSRIATYSNDFYTSNDILYIGG